jgi:hypothetical protein
MEGNSIKVKCALVYISAMFLAFTGFYFLLRKKFNKHPYQLFGWACLFHAAYFASYFEIFFVCTIQAERSFAVSWGLFASIQ